MVCPSVTLDGAVKVTTTVSSDSAIESSTMVRTMLVEVSPGGISSVLIVTV